MKKFFHLLLKNRKEKTRSEDDKHSIELEMRFPVALLSLLALLAASLVSAGDPTDKLVGVHGKKD